jgi:DNA-binding transcriptional ArsR family regulator
LFFPGGILSFHPHTRIQQRDTGGGLATGARAARSTGAAATSPTGIHGWFNALADPTRTRLLAVLARHELSVGELCEVLALPQSTVSRHLRVLLREGWVATRPEGTSRPYRLARLGDTAERLWQAVRPELETSPEAEADEVRALRAIELRRTERAGIRRPDGCLGCGAGAAVRSDELQVLPALLDPA